MQKGCWKFITLVCIFLQSCTSVQLSEQLAYGKFKYCQGDFRQAFRLILPVAISGNPQAEYALGYMYYYGYGAPEDLETGLFWMRRAAAQHNCYAIKALNIIYAGPSTCFGAAAEESFGPPLCSPPIPPRPLCVMPPCGAEQDIVLRTIERHACMPCMQKGRLDYLPATLPAQIAETPSPLYPGERVVRSASPLPTTTIVEGGFPNNPQATVIEKYTPPFPQRRILERRFPLHRHARVIEYVPRSYPRVIRHKVIERPLLIPYSYKSEKVHPNQYTLQVFGAYQLKHVEGLQQALELENKTHIWHTKNHGRDWYVLTRGKYHSITQASLAQTKLPLAVKNLGPWVRSLNGLKFVS